MGRKLSSSEKFAYSHQRRSLPVDIPHQSSIPLHQRPTFMYLDKSNLIFSSNHCSYINLLNFTLHVNTCHTNFDLQNVVFNIAKGWNDQNLSLSNSHQCKNSPSKTPSLPNFLMLFGKPGIGYAYYKTRLNWSNFLDGRVKIDIFMG